MSQRDLNVKPGLLISLALLTLVGVAVFGCDYRHDKGDARLAQDSTSWYEAVRERVFVPSCISCHGSLGGVNLETYAAIKGNLDRIYQAAILTRTMPKGGNLDSDAYAMLSEWIQAGAPIDRPVKPGSSPAPSPEPLKPTFVSIEHHIFRARCYGCHTPGGQAENVPLSPLSDLINSPRELVIPRDSADSGLFIAVSRRDEKRMPPPSSGEPVLPAVEIEMIQSWIDRGAPEDGDSRAPRTVSPL